MPVSGVDIAIAQSDSNRENLEKLSKKVAFLEKEIIDIKYGDIKTLDDFVNKMGKDYVIDLEPNLIEFDLLNKLLSKIFTHTRPVAPIVIYREWLRLVYREKWVEEVGYGGWETINENKNPYVKSITLGEILEDSKTLPKKV